MGPKRNVSGPRRAISSTGRQPSKYGVVSNSWFGWYCSPASSAATKALYCSAVSGALR